MTRRSVVASALALAAAGVAAVGFAAATAGDVARGVSPAEPHLQRAYPLAAAAAYGRRVLVLHARPLAPVEGEILESARAGGGWELHPAAPDGAEEIAAALATVAVDAASDWRAEGRLSAATVDALARAAVAIVVVEDGRRVVVAEDAAETPGLAAEASVPSLRVRAAEPVSRVVGSDLVDGRERARLEPARVRDLEDGLWGGSVVVEVVEPGTYVFAWPRETANVVVDGAAVTPAAPVPGVPPFVTLELAAGDVAVTVSHAATAGRAAWAIGGVVAIVAGLLALMLALRPHPGRDADAPRDEGTASS